MHAHTKAPQSLTVFKNNPVIVIVRRCFTLAAGGDPDCAAAGREDFGPEGGGVSRATGEAEQGAEDPAGGAGGNSQRQTQAQCRRPGG